MVAVGEDLILVGQVGAARVDQVDAGKMVFLGDLLRAQVFFHRHRVVGAALHGGVVADHHDLLPMHPADACDHARCGCSTVIHIMCGRRADLQERRARIEEVRHPAPRQHLAPAFVPRAGFLAAAHARSLSRLADLRKRVQMRRAVLFEAFGGRHRLGCEFHVHSPVVGLRSLNPVGAAYAGYATPRVIGLPLRSYLHCASELLV